MPITTPTTSYYTSVNDLSLPMTREGSPQETGKLIIHLDIHRDGPVLVWGEKITVKCLTKQKILISEEVKRL